VPTGTDGDSRPFSRSINLAQKPQAFEVSQIYYTMKANVQAFVCRQALTAAAVLSAVQ